MIGGAREPRADVPLAPLSTLGVGGPARWYAHATSVEQVKSLARGVRLKLSDDDLQVLTDAGK